MTIIKNNLSWNQRSEYRILLVQLGIYPTGRSNGTERPLIRTAQITGEYRPFRPVNLIRAVKKIKKVEEKKPKSSHYCHTTHHNVVVVVSERYHVVEQLFPNCRCFFFFAFFLFSFFFHLLRSSWLCTLLFYISLFCPLYWIVNSEYWCE